MALDGITIAALTRELKDKLLGGRISKIAQPESDELLLTIKTQTSNERLLISAGASLPFVYLTDENKPSPMTAPNFCMVLRKHILGGHITDISQPGLERIIEITVDHLDEMGDPCRKIITIELMGKHSNIIFRKSDNTIIDAIKHVSVAVSSVREVLPGRMYFIPNTEDKVCLHNFILCKQNAISSHNTDVPSRTMDLASSNMDLDSSNTDLDSSNTDLASSNMDSPSSDDAMAKLKQILCKPTSVQKALYTTFTGFSPVLAESLCIQAGVDSSKNANGLTDDELCKLYDRLLYLHNIIYVNQSFSYTPSIILSADGNPIEFEVLPLAQYMVEKHESYSSVSEVLQVFYARRNEITRIRQKSSDLRKIVQTALERCIKKYDLQSKQLKDTEKMDKYRLYGELLQTYGYLASDGDKEITCENYYNGEEITIPLDPTLSAMANSVRYFDKYGKLKRTKEAVSEQLVETQKDIEHLRSVMTSLDIAVNESDLAQIKEELTDSGYIRRKSFQKGKSKIKSEPFHYVSTDGFHIFVGKNNYQNDELTFKTANAGDWWFHAKKIPGSHVIVRLEGREMTDLAFLEAASLAAYYSAGRNQGKVEVDYVRRKEVKKPNGAKPGFVVYYTNYSMVAPAEIPKIKKV